MKKHAIVKVKPKPIIKTKNIYSTSVGLVFDKKTSFEEWHNCGFILSQAEKLVHWFIGDWVLFGEQAKYSEKYKKVIEETGFAYSTIRHDKAIAATFKMVRRRTNLSWSHHECVNGLSIEEQDHFLDLAEKNNWTLAQFRGALNKHKQKQLAAGGERIKNSAVIYGDFREVCKKFKDESIDHIITDPPYAAQYLELWSDLSKVASRILKPTGFCICYSGQFHLPEVLERLSEHLTYWWPCVVFHYRGQFIKPRGLNTLYKPVLVFVKPPTVIVEPPITDVIKGTGKEKNLHEWQQNLFEAEELVKRFTDEGDMILDPMAGSGTIPLAAKRMGRKCLAIDNKKINVNIMKKRLRDEEKR